MTSIRNTLILFVAVCSVCSTAGFVRLADHLSTHQRQIPQFSLAFSSTNRLSMRGGAKRSSTAMRLFKDAARAGLQSSSIMLIADVITQLLLEKRVLFKKDDDTNL